MNILSLNLTKISAERKQTKKPQKPKSTNIEFLDLEKESSDILKNSDLLKVSFKYELFYSSEDLDSASQVIFEGIIIVSASAEEAKEALKSWKKKELPNQLKIPIFNLILRKCSPKAVSIEDDLDLPCHLPYPKLTPQQNPELKETSK